MKIMLAWKDLDDLLQLKILDTVPTEIGLAFVLPPIYFGPDLASFK